MVSIRAYSSYILNCMVYHRCSIQLVWCTVLVLNDIYILIYRIYEELYSPVVT